MTTSLQTINQKDAIDFLLHTLFDYLDKKGYLNIIYNAEKGQIPGFSKRNASKAPLSRIKNIAKQHMKKISNGTEFLTNYISNIKEKYEGLTFHEFYTKISIDKKLSDGEKLALFFLLYQEEYQLYEEKIQENIRNKLPPLDNILSLSLADKLNSLYFTSKKPEIFQEKNYKKYFNTDEKLFSYDEKEGMTLKEKLNNESLPTPNKGYYLSVFEYFLNERENWEDSEKTAFLQLVIGDLMSLIEKKVNTVMKLEEKNHERLQLIENSNKQADTISSLEKEVRQYKDEIDDLELKINLLLQQSEEQKKEITRLGEKNDTYRKKIQIHQSNYVKLQEKYNEQKKVENKLKEIYFFQKEKLYFISKIKSDEFSLFFTDDQLIYLHDNVDLNEMIKKKDDDAIYFINVDGVSTRESFKLEKPLKENGCIYRVVSGGVVNIIRKIIYYLEGEFRYEVKEKH